jgi:hypothetical protein
MTSRLQNRRDTAAAWTSANPTLAAGEMGLETDTSKWKMGDGATAWNSLAYAYTAGSAGAQGTTGTQGAIGTQGLQGVTGAQGQVGQQGVTGSQGLTGIQGAIGLQGLTGAQGTTGTQGLTGSQGIQGVQGTVGNAGGGISGFNAQTGTSYTLVIGDLNKLVTAQNAGGITVTVPPSVFAANDVVNVQQIAAGQVTFAAGSGVTITSNGATVAAPKLRAQYSACSIICTVGGATPSFTVIGDVA